jgi:hypothetical protein
MPIAKNLVPEMREASSCPLSIIRILKAGFKYAKHNGENV